MSDTPKFEVIDRRKIKAEEEQEGQQAAAPEAEAAKASTEPTAGPRLVTNESRREPAAAEPQIGAALQEPEAELPPPPTAQESHEQKTAYDASAQRIEDLIRAQNPGVGAPPPMNFETLVQQFYVSAMIQMGAGTQEGQRPRVDILGARTTIDMLGVLAEKTKGNLTDAEDRTLQSVLFDVRMAFLELTSMINAPGVPPPPPPGKK
ncbi:MAG: DUF1844 domain-containing protein [Acidobacteriota bacterium]|nr:DUF1844 domain-containing protein [Acidobacteriota bacterium]